MKAERVFIFNDLNKPTAIFLNKTRLLVGEKTTVLIYSINDFKFIKKFGKEGEGPMEFKSDHRGKGIEFTVYSNKIYINSETKLSLFSLDGKFIKEYRVLPRLSLIPVGKNFVSKSLTKRESYFPKKSISLYNQDFKKIKDLFVSDTDSGMGAKIPILAYNMDYKYYKGKIYASTGKYKIKIDVFDENGKKRSSIIKDFGKRPLTNNYIRQIKKCYKTNPKTKNFWEYFKKNLSFVKYFPGLRSFNICNDRIYVQTYKKKSNKAMWIVFDINGKELGNLFLDSVENNILNLYPYTIFDNYLYVLKENDEAEIWELHKYKIPKL